MALLLALALPTTCFAVAESTERGFDLGEVNDKPLVDDIQKQEGNEPDSNHAVEDDTEGDIDDTVSSDEPSSDDPSSETDASDPPSYDAVPEEALEKTDGDALVAPQRIVSEADEAVLVANRFTGVDPAGTTVNLFDYTSYKNPDTGSDEMSNGNAGAWLGGTSDTNINHGHALAFGNGMNDDMGYWNAGSGSGQGVFSLYTPGFQNIVAPLLGTDGYPELSTESMTVTGSADTLSFPTGGSYTLEKKGQWPQVGGYDDNPVLYATAKRYGDNLPSWAKPGTLLFANAGGKNVSDTVQNQWDHDASLAYLFSADAPDTASRPQTCTDVKGLFQIDDEGYYYYNMRENFAQYTAEAVEGRDGIIPANSFVLYDEPAGIRTDGSDSVGNFFPFNTGEEVFVVKDGELVSDVYSSNNGNAGSASNQGQGKPLMNHHLGLSMETSFRQPAGGAVANKPMTFEFIGDDDMWVFIDDVLVLDLGGIHSELYGTINFTTGAVELGTAFDTNGAITTPAVRTTTIKDMFEAAGKDTSVGFNGSTFSSNTSHTLKMFYFERGNYDSSLSVRFNLQPELYQQVKKVDQDGNPVEGAEFLIYPVTSTTAASAEQATLDNSVFDDAAPLATVVTDASGMARFMDENGENPFNFADRVNDSVESRLYVLQERTAPAGYRLMPSPLLLRYDQSTGTFIVNNRYETGSYASFNSYVNQTSSAALRFGAYDTDTGHITATTTTVPVSHQEKGLVVAIPTICQEDRNASRWDPLYGSNNGGLDTIAYDATQDDSMRMAMLQAALYQAYLSSIDPTVPAWYLNWNGAEQRLNSYYTDSDQLVCTLSDLPGNPTRYILNNADGDMQMVYGIVSGEVFGGMSNTMTEKEKYAFLAHLVKDGLHGTSDPSAEQLAEAVKAVAAFIAQRTTPGADAPFSARGFSAIDTSAEGQFERSFRTVINIPNEQRELRVWKIDQNDNRVNGAVFALFDTEAGAKAAVDATVSATGAVTRVTDKNGNDVAHAAAGVTGDLTGANNRYQGDDLDGMLIFAPYVQDAFGGAHTTWSNPGDEDGSNGRVLFLKEVKAPIGFEPNNTVIPVIVGQYGVYADAGNEFDGVDVLAGVGKLNATMTKYAASPHVNLTLRYITSIMQNRSSDSTNFTTDSATGRVTVSFDDFNAGWVSNANKRMDLVYGDENALIDYGSPEGFTEAQIDQGIGYIDAKGRERPLFRTSTGYIRTYIEQDTAAMRAAQASGDYAGVMGDNLSGQNLTNLFMIRNTVRVVDTRHAAPQIQKMDQNGEPVAGASFELFPVSFPAGTSDAAIADATLDSATGEVTLGGTTVARSDVPLASMTTDESGRSEFVEVDAAGAPTGDLVDFAARAREQGMQGGRLYVLREKKAPAGYRSMVSDMLVRYELEASTLMVNNRYDTGASAGFTSFVTVDTEVHFGTYDAESGEFAPLAETMSDDEKRKGLIVAIPMCYSGNVWRPLFGSATTGYETPDGHDERAILKAALEQARGAGEPWHLDWNDSIGTLVGEIEGLPGTPDRYRLKNPDGDMRMLYAHIGSHALGKLGIDTASGTEACYAALGAAAGKDMDATLATLLADADGFRFIDTDDFDRNFQSVIYIPNEQRELRVWKIGPEGERIDGAVFALFDERADAERARSAQVSGGKVAKVLDASGAVVTTFAAGVTGSSSATDADGDQHGALLFAPYVGDGEGSAHTMWIDGDGDDLIGRILYLKEVDAPDGYLPNDTIVPVVIGRYGVYADAGTADDGVDVLAGVGKLSAPLKKFASSPQVNLTLRYMLSSAQVQPSLTFGEDGSADDDRIVGDSIRFDAFDADWSLAVRGPSSEEGDDPADAENGDSGEGEGGLDDAAGTAEGGDAKTMELIYGAPNALVEYGAASAFTPEELEDGIGYVDASGVQRPLFVAQTGFLRTYVQQDADAMRAAQASGGEYANVKGDDLEGKDLTPLFMLRNIVRVTDERDPNWKPPTDDDGGDGGATPRPVSDAKNADGSASLGRTGDLNAAALLSLIAIGCGGAGLLFLQRARLCEQTAARARSKHARRAS